MSEETDPEQYLDIPPYYDQIGDVTTTRVLMGDLVIGYDQNPQAAQYIDEQRFSSGYVVLALSDDGSPDNRSLYYDPLTETVMPVSRHMHLYRRKPNSSPGSEETLQPSIWKRPVDLPNTYRLIHLDSLENLQSGDYLMGKLSALSQRKYMEEAVDGLVIRTTERSSPVIFSLAFYTPKKLYPILMASEGESRTHDLIVDVYRPTGWLIYTGQLLTLCSNCQNLKERPVYKCHVCSTQFCCFSSFQDACLYGQHRDVCRAPRKN